MNSTVSEKTTRNWGSTIRITLVGTICCSAVAVAATALLFSGHGGGAFQLALISAGVISAIIAAPLIAALVYEKNKFASLRSEVSRLSSVDALTSCLTGSVFASLIDTFRSGGSSNAGKGQGALLVVDVDDFKQINERFGHAWGDEVLRIVAGAIKASVRSGDLVGRIGGTEFGVFLPGASRENAESVAERVRRTISDTLLEPGGRTCPLTVSVGAVLFQEQLEFDELFRTAEAQLTEAKAQGPNNIEFTEMAKSASKSAGFHA